MKAYYRNKSLLEQDRTGKGDKMINNLSGSIIRGQYKLSWYINTKTKKGNVLLQETESKVMRGTGLEETERKTEIVEFGNKVNHLIYENKYIKIHCISNKEGHMITEYIDWEEIKHDWLEAERKEWEEELKEEYPKVPTDYIEITVDQALQEGIRDASIVSEWIAGSLNKEGELIE